VRLTRRELLAATGAVALGLPVRARAARRRGRVVVVGAGLAGLACARELTLRGLGVTVFEARDRVGGRVLTLRDAFSGGQYAEGGAEFIGAHDTYVQALARSLGMKLERVPVDRDGVVYRRGRRLPNARFATLRIRADVERFWHRIETLGRGIDPRDPAKSGRALDARSALSVIRELRLGDRARFLVEHELRLDFGVEAESLSLLFLVQQAKIGHRQERKYRIRGGNDLLPLALAGGLDVRLETPVQGIERGQNGVTVTAGGDDVDADWCVLAVPVPLLGSIEFDPGLPLELASAVERLRYGHAVKTALQYEQRFWKDAGDSGSILSDLTFGTAWNAFVRPGTQGILVADTSGRDGFLYGTMGKRSRTLLVADEIDDAYPGSRALFEAGETVSWHTDGWSLGSSVAYAPAQVTRFWDAVRRPVGRLLLAGDQADVMSGTMEGALRSGRRVAALVAAS
jgi:monoamine oxidase